MLVVMPGSHLSGGNALREIVTDEGFVSVQGINVFPRQQPTHPRPWGAVRRP